MRTAVWITLVMVATCRALADCTPPTYRVGQSIGVSIRPADFTLSNLVCLAATLKQKELGARPGSVFIFDSAQASDYYEMSPFVPTTRQSLESIQHLRAVYELRGDDREEEVHHIATKGARSVVQQRMERAALENLSAWWFEPASTDSTFEVAYAFGSDSLRQRAIGLTSLSDCQTRLRSPPRLSSSGYSSRRSAIGQAGALVPLREVDCGPVTPLIPGTNLPIKLSGCVSVTRNE